MKRPWNLPDSAVYSLATYSGDQFNMNICTYVTAVSMQPKLYAIAVYDGTRTQQYILQNDVAVLQYLHASQYSLVRKLGQTSATQYDKMAYLRKKQLTTEWKGCTVLKDVAALVALRKIHQYQTGDHLLCIFEATAYKSYSSEILTTRLLGEMKIIRI